MRIFAPIFIRNFAPGLLAVLLVASAVAAQTASPKAANPAKAETIIPVGARIPTPPTAFRGDGVWHLCYEIDLTNLSADTWTLQRIQVRNESDTTLATIEGAALESALYHPARPRAAKPEPTTPIAPGEAVVAFLWIDLPVNAAIPVSLQHQLSLKKAGSETSVEMDAASTTVASKLPEIVSPLRGTNWVAANGPSNNSAHRRTIIVYQGIPYIAQRYAIDWVQLGDTGAKTYHGDSKDNASYYCFGTEAHAVADATVVEVKDGIPENVPNQTPVVPITWDTVAGNHVNLDLGGGVYAMYAHLQPGSIRVKVGDKVTPGQVIGLVGNTGNSSEPHLHFQLMSRNSPLGSEGLPYALPSFTLLGRTGGDENNPKIDRLSTPEKHHGEIPLEDEVVGFEP